MVCNSCFWKNKNQHNNNDKGEIICILVDTVKMKTNI